MTDLDLQYLRGAKVLSEKPRLGAKLAQAVGSPIEKGLGLLPEKWRERAEKAAQKSIDAALKVALKSLPQKEAPFTGSKNLLHKALVVGTGGVGGFFGISSLLVELPVSTTIMMRSILDIARSEGEDLSQPEVQLACLQVFALGGPGTNDDAVETGYFATRAALAKALSQAATVLGDRTLAREGAPLLTRFIANIASRFQVVISEKIAAQMVPLIGAIGGSGLNLLFMDHFQEVARGHFIIRRLEKKYGINEVKKNYDSL